MKIESSDNPQDADFLMKGLSAEAQAKKGLQPVEPINYFLRDDAGNTVGGVIGYIVYGALHIDTLFIAKEYRGQGFGRALVLKAEARAKEKNCAFSWVGTMDFEAQGFYEKLGYSQVYVSKGYTEDSKLIFLRKGLDA